MANGYQIFKDRSEFSAYHAWRRDHPHGFVLHVKPGSHGSYMYHQAQCSHLDPEPDETLLRERKGRFKYWKICAESRKTLDAWRTEQYPQTPGRDCSQCL